MGRTCELHGFCVLDIWCSVVVTKQFTVALRMQPPFVTLSQHWGTITRSLLQECWCNIVFKFNMQTLFSDRAHGFEGALVAVLHWLYSRWYCTRFAHGCSLQLREYWWKHGTHVWWLQVFNLFTLKLLCRDQNQDREINNYYFIQIGFWLWRKGTRVTRKFTMY